MAFVQLLLIQTRVSFINYIVHIVHCVSDNFASLTNTHFHHLSLE